MSTLRELTGELLELRKMAEDPEIDSQAIADTLEGIQGTLEIKAESIAKVYRQLEADQIGLKDEINRLQTLHKVRAGNMSWLLDYLSNNMQAAQIKKISRPLFTITWSDGREICHIEDEEEIPDDYVNVEVVSKPDKKQILADLKAGKSIPGASIGRGKPSVRIR